MQKKVIGVLLLLIIAIMCCGCVTQTPSKQTSSPPHNEDLEEDYEFPEAEDEYEFDITYKKEKDDLSPPVYITQYGEHYHTPNCHYSQYAYMRLTVKQAWDRGYLPCSFCCF